MFGYVIFVVIGFCILRSKEINPNNLKYMATRNLPVGYRLHSDDFTFDPSVPVGKRGLLPPESDPIGKYLLRACAPGKQISVKDLSVVPIIQVSAGKSKYFFSLQNQTALADILNTDSRVDVCAETCVIENARVASIVCDEAPSSKCSAVLELSKEEAALISGQGKDDYRLFRRGN